MFSFRWFRSAVRNRMAPIPKDTARMWRNRLSTAYMFLGFNIMAVIMYISKRDKLELVGDPTKSRVERFQSLVAEGTNITVIEVQGMAVKQSYEVKAEER